jgi:hypothetical protein
MSANLPEERKTISIHVANLAAADASFIQGVIALFSDPRLAKLADRLRNSDNHHLRYGQRGTARVCADLTDQ